MVITNILHSPHPTRPSLATPTFPKLHTVLVQMAPQKSHPRAPEHSKNDVSQNHTPLRDVQLHRFHPKSRVMNRVRRRNVAVLLDRLLIAEERKMTAA